MLTCRTVRRGISQCEEFLELSQAARLDLVGELNLCRLCLAHCEGKIKHKKCKWRNKIRDELCQEQNKCRRSHNRLLHVGAEVMRNLQAARSAMPAQPPDRPMGSPAACAFTGVMLAEAANERGEAVHPQILSIYMDKGQHLQENTRKVGEEPATVDFARPKQ